MVKAIKECPQCRSSIHAATKTCYCGYVFYKRRQRKVKGKKQEVDWRTLVSGDKIKIISSDYWEDKTAKPTLWEIVDFLRFLGLSQVE